MLYIPSDFVTMYDTIKNVCAYGHMIYMYKKSNAKSNMKSNIGNQKHFAKPKWYTRPISHRASILGFCISHVVFCTTAQKSQ